MEEYSVLMSVYQKENPVFFPKQHREYDEAEASLL